MAQHSRRRPHGPNKPDSEKLVPIYSKLPSVVVKAARLVKQQTGRSLSDQLEAGLLRDRLLKSIRKQLVAEERSSSKSPPTT